MTQRPDDTRLHDWLDETMGQTPDPVEGTRQVMSQIEETSQVGRWLPFPVFHRKAKAKTPTTDHTTEYQPSPIPITDGHTPTVSGRTQFMFSPAKAITAGALVFALGGVFLIAQPFDQQGGDVPGAATDDESMKPALVSGFLVHPENSVDIWDLESFEETTQDGIRREHYVDTANIEMSDSRLTGSITLDVFSDRFEGAGHPATDVGWGTVRIENAAGVWEGTTVDTGDLAAGGRGIGYYELVGSGAYQGLSAIVFETETPEEESAWSGIIFPGDLPPDR
jgi:hypothetical protein